MTYMKQNVSTRSLPIPGAPGPIENEIPISQLPLAGQLLGDEMIPLVQNGIDKRAPAQAIASIFTPLPPPFNAPYMEQLTVTGINTLAPLAYVPDMGLFQLIINGRMFLPIGRNPPFSVGGNRITWLSTIWGFVPGDDVQAVYTVSHPLAASAPFVQTWNGRQGPVSLALNDVTNVGGAPIASPAFTGNPTAPTQPPGDSSADLATTAFVTNAVVAATTGVASFNARTGAVTLSTADVTNVGGATVAGVAATYAPLASPAFTGNPTAPTPAAGDNSGNLATTGFVASSFLPITTAAATYAPLASPTFTGTVTAAALTVSGLLTPSGGIKGVTDGSNAAPGNVGYFTRADQTTNVSMVNNTAANITSLPLSAGDWDVVGVGIIAAASAGCTMALVSLSTTSAAASADPLARSELYAQSGAVFAAGNYLPVTRCRLSLTAPTTVYLVGMLLFSGTASMQGSIGARLVR